jgi:hypothetical protein
VKSNNLEYGRIVHEHISYNKLLAAMANAPSTGGGLEDRSDSLRPPHTKDSWVSTLPQALAATRIGIASPPSACARAPAKCTNAAEGGSDLDKVQSRCASRKNAVKSAKEDIVRSSKIRSNMWHPSASEASPQAAGKKLWACEIGVSNGTFIRPSSQLGGGVPPTAKNPERKSFGARRCALLLSKAKIGNINAVANGANAPSTSPATLMLRLSKARRSAVNKEPNRLTQAQRKSSEHCAAPLPSSSRMEESPELGSSGTIWMGLPSSSHRRVNFAGTCIMPFTTIANALALSLRTNLKSKE